MIHEVLFYLRNCPQDFPETNSLAEQWVNFIQLNKYLHNGERNMLEKIISTASRYHRIQAFIKLVSSSQINNQESEIKTGLYVEAFCNGVDEVLETYRNEVQKLEGNFLENPQLPLMWVNGNIEKFVTLFIVLEEMIEMIKQEKLHGCLIMDKLLSYANCGISLVVDATYRIVQSVSTRFYRHLCNWLIYGELFDLYDEFFIYDAKCPDENFLYPENKKSRIKKPELVRKFCLKQEMLPKSISVKTAETILFIGRIVWIIRNNPKMADDEKYQLKLKKDIWEGKDAEYYKAIKSLEKRPFNVSEFEKTIQECKLKLTKFLWGIMLEEANLLEHLQLIRDYYGLGRGELFQQFIMTSEEQLKQTPSDKIVQNLNFIFSDTARKIYSENDKTYLRFELLQRSQFDKKMGNDPWANIEINFEVLWPLHIVFHPNAMNLYNRLFSFLLRVKKTGIDLHKLWLVQLKKKLKVNECFWTLRRNLMFIVDNLQYYLEVDVIEALFSELQKSVKMANEFEDIIRLHTAFLTDLLTRSFVMVRDKNAVTEHKHELYQLPPLNYEETSEIYRVIIKIVKLCDKFCAFANTWDNEVTSVNLDELQNLQADSDILIETLLQQLYVMYGKSSGGHLLQLLRQLDFNRWFSKNKSDLNFTIS